MSIVGRRGTSESGWSWVGPPRGYARRALPRPSLLAVMGLGGAVTLIAALSVLGVWLAGGNDGGAGASGGPTPTLSPATPTPTAAATPVATATPSSTPPPGGNGPLFRLAVWDGERWEDNPRRGVPSYREGQAVPVLLRADRAGRGRRYTLTIGYDCTGFSLFTTYSRDRGSAPALAAGGPERSIPDSATFIPDDPGTTADDGAMATLALWGASFAAVGPWQPPSACAGEKTMSVNLTTVGATFHLIWAVEIAEGAADRGEPLRIGVQVEGAQGLSLEIPPDAVAAAP